MSDEIPSQDPTPTVPQRCLTFFSGWRPAGGWAFVGIMVTNFIFFPFTEGVVDFIAKRPIAFPRITLGELTALGAMFVTNVVARSIDKAQGVNS